MWENERKPSAERNRGVYAREAPGPSGTVYRWRASVFPADVSKGAKRNADGENPASHTTVREHIEEESFAYSPGRGGNMIGKDETNTYLSSNITEMEELAEECWDFENKRMRNGKQRELNKLMYLLAKADSWSSQIMELERVYGDVRKMAHILKGFGI